MNRRKDVILTLLGILIGMTISSPSAIAALTATPSTNVFYVDGKQVQMEAYAIGGNNYVKLRDIGKTVDFNVYWDGSVQIQSNAPYTGEAPAETVNADIRQEMIRLINQVRKENGVAELTINTALMDAAQDCSAQGFTYHDTRYECEAALAYGYPHGVACNLTVFTGVATKDIAQHAVTNWVNSSGHFQTMIASRYDSIGVGVTVVGGKAYCYMIVGNPHGHNPYEP